MRVFRQHSVGLAHLCGEVFCDLLGACGAQAGCAGFYISAANLRHTGRGRSLARGIGKDMQPSQVAVAHQFEAVFKMRLGFGGKACNDISAKGHIGAQLAGGFAKPDGIITQMPALHPFQDQIVAMLQAQVKMRHQPRFGRNGLHKVLINLNTINAADPQPRQIRDQF